VYVDGTPAVGEVEYFFRLQFGETVHSLALVSVFSPPDQELLDLSHHAVYICHSGGMDALTVVDVKAITAVVSMVPDFQVTAEGEIIIPDNRFSLVEALFLKLAALCGALGEDDDTNDNDNGTAM
jgi:hypothetical protein